MSNKSTAMILEITEQFGGTHKQEMVRKLKLLRDQVRREVVRGVNKTLEDTKELYRA